MAEDCKIIKDYGLVAKHGDVELRLRLVSWYGNEPKMDLRAWINDFGKGGMVLTKEQLQSLQKLLHEYIPTMADEDVSEPVDDSKKEVVEEKPAPKKEEKVKESKAAEKKDKKKDADGIDGNIIEALTTLKTSDPGYMKALGKANEKELALAVEIMNGKMSKPSTSITGKKRGRPAGSSKKATERKTTKKREKKADVIQFPKPKPELENKLVTKGDATYEECEAKVNKEREMFKDSDSEYVLVGLLELCKVDADFRNNFMREDKSFTGVMEYMGKQVQAGYGYNKGNMGWCDKDAGLGFAIDYYNTDESVKETTAKVETEEEGEEDEA